MGSRIKKHPILGAPEKGKKVTFICDGRTLEGYEGDQNPVPFLQAAINKHRYTKK